MNHCASAPTCHHGHAGEEAPRSISNSPRFQGKPTDQAREFPRALAKLALFAASAVPGLIILPTIEQRCTSVRHC